MPYIMQLDLFQESPENEIDNQPKVYVGGSIGCYSQREARLMLSRKGMEPASAPSKFVCLFLIGEDAKPEHLEIIEKLAFNGFYIPVFRGEEAVRLLEADIKDWPDLKPVQKNIVIDLAHYERFHIDMAERRNPIYGREIFFGKGWRGDFTLLNQMTGFLGSCGDFDHTWPETDMIALSDSTIDCLRSGEQDDTSRYIAEHYNRSDAITFSYKFISESDILSLCQRWAEEYGCIDMARYLNMYRHSEACECFVALDFETVGGLQVDGKTYRHLPLSVGMFKVRCCQEAGRYSSLMRPPVADGVKYACYVDRSLNQETLRDAPTYDEVYRRMAEFCAYADYLVCHNHTEGHVLKELAELCGYAIDKPIRDTLQILVRHGETDNSLTAACLRHGVCRTGKEHDALSDAESCAALYLQLLKSGIVEETSHRAPVPAHRSRHSGEAGDTSAYRHQVDESEKIPGSRFDGLSVVITGMAYDERDKLYRYLHQRGAVVKRDVNGRVDWLVLGPNGAGSTRKVNRARELGVRIMELEELLRMIEEESSIE